MAAAAASRNSSYYRSSSLLASRRAGTTTTTSPRGRRVKLTGTPSLPPCCPLSVGGSSEGYCGTEAGRILLETLNKFSTAGEEEKKEREEGIIRHHPP